MAQSYDNTGEYEEPAAQDEGARPPSETVTEPEAATQPKATVPESDDSKPDISAEPGKEDTKYQKAQKEAARREKSWQALEAEKAEFRQQQEQFRKEMEEIRGQVVATPPAERKVSPAQAKDADGRTARDWQRWSEKLTADADLAEAKGEIEQAHKLRLDAKGASYRAEDILEQAAIVPASQSAPSYSPEEWQAGCAQAVNKFPSLKDASSPLFQAAQVLLEKHDIFKATAQGPLYAAEVAALQMESAKVSGLEAQIETQRKEIERLNGATALSGSSPARVPTSKRYEDMSPAEQEAYDLNLALSADANGTPLSF